MIETELMFVFMKREKKEYVVSLEQFEGPLDLLHQLIEKRKMQINTVSLAKITADYMAHIQKTSDVSAEDVAKFVYIASILILIKSKSLLPILEYTNEEAVDVAELEDRMKLFDYIRARAVPKLNHWKKASYPTQVPKQVSRVVFNPDNSCTLDGLRHNAGVVVFGLSFLKERPRRSVEKTIRIEEVLERVLSAVAGRVSLSFREMSLKAGKKEKIVSFLAILELMRKNLLMATQGSHFDDIVIAKQKQAV